MQALNITNCGVIEVSLGVGIVNVFVACGAFEGSRTAMGVGYHRSL